MSRGTIASLRDMVPIRPLTRNEALGIAERQSLRFLELVGVTEPAVPEHVIAELPRTFVTRTRPYPVSGATHWVSGRWVIVLNANEATVRQRFSLAHELKHIVDHIFADVLYSRIPAADRDDWIEHVCDYFAGCLLMPRPWLKRAWTTESQHVPTLARKFHVSQAAMNTRLAQVGLSEPTKRCARPTRDWAVKAIRDAGGRNLYHRKRDRVLQLT
jgi:Zn-dependent peptidase ImmA (M78 family)